MSDYVRRRSERGGFMIKLQDFARQYGVTDRQVQRLLKKYENELEGLYERKGPNGTWLSDEACEILRSKMKQQPIVVSKTSEVVEDLRKKNEKLHEALETAKDMIIDLQEQNHQLELENAKLALLEAQNADLSNEKDFYLQKAAEAEKNAQKLSDELSEARKQFEDKMHLLQNELQAEKIRKLSWKERLLGKK